jgi:hypothetical protein
MGHDVWKMEISVKTKDLAESDRHTWLIDWLIDWYSRYTLDSNPLQWKNYTPEAMNYQTNPIIKYQYYTVLVLIVIMSFFKEIYISNSNIFNQLKNWAKR